MKDLEKITIESSVAQAIRKQESLKRTKKVKRTLTPEHIAKLNRNGRPKGAKGKLTLLREAVLNKAETMVLEDWEDVVATTLTLAKSGDSTALKILWDRITPSIRAVDTSSGATDKLNITINIGGLEDARNLEVSGVMDEAIDADFTTEESE
jgi:hypothetical protein